MELIKKEKIQLILISVLNNMYQWTSVRVKGDTHKNE